MYPGGVYAAEGGFPRSATVHGNLEVVHRGGLLQQVAIVLGVVDGALGIVAGERPHRVHRLPVGDEDELGAVIDKPAEDGDAEVPRGVSILAEAGPLQVVEVLVDVLGAGGAAPDAGDQPPPTPHTSLR